MLNQFNEKIFGELVKKRNEKVLDANKVKEILNASKMCRSVDYVYDFDVVNGNAKTKSCVTRANWLFILTNAACWWENLTVGQLPKVLVEFKNFDPNTPFNTPADDWGAVPCSIVFGREGLTRFEEYKNLFYILDQRFVISLDVKPNLSYSRGHVLLSGIEVDLESLKNG